MLIDSETLITRYCQSKCGHHATVCRYPCEVVRMIREEPEAVKQGMWAWDNRFGLYTCSVCGALSPREDQDGERIDCPAYCHECGAKMDGGGGT